MCEDGKQAKNNPGLITDHFPIQKCWCKRFNDLPPLIRGSLPPDKSGGGDRDLPGHLTTMAGAFSSLHLLQLALIATLRRSRADLAQLKGPTPGGTAPACILVASPGD